MAKVTTEYDTKTKEMACYMDGTLMENCDGVHMYRQGKLGDKSVYGMEISCSAHNSDDGTYVNHRVMAADSDKAKKAIAEGNAFKWEGIDELIIVREENENL